VETVSGLFALAGVALAAAFGELRAWRESSTQRSSELYKTRRETYALALQNVEAVAGRMAEWAKEGGDASVVWESLTAAYTTMNTVALVAVDRRTPEAMSGVLRIYREALEAEHRVMPKPRAERRELVLAFRRDLGLKG
jgi:hypothetical protein